MPLYGVEAVNLRSSNFGEADKLMTLFSRSCGKIRAVAKGARRTSSKFGGRLEIFAYNQYLLAGGRNLDIISQCETIQTFRKLREDPEKIGPGAYVLRLTEIMTEDGQKDTPLFELLIDTLRMMEEHESVEWIDRAFEVRLCEIEGFLPSADMLERSHSGLSKVADSLRAAYNGDRPKISEKDLAISGKIFKEIISDHSGVDVRRVRTGI